MSPASRRLAGILLVILPTVIFGVASLLTVLVNDPRYMQNPLRHALRFFVVNLFFLMAIDEPFLIE